MPNVNQRRRIYRSVLRDQQSAATRRAVLDAGRRLFLSQGYGATTIDQIATAAGVSKPTVFTAVGNKQAVLAAVRDVALAGDDLPVAISDREPFQAVLAEPDPYRAIVLMVEHLADLWGRYAPIREVLRGAASSGEPALRELWELAEEQRLIGARKFIDALGRKGPLRDGLSQNAATDIMWTQMSPDNYLNLVVSRGWTVTAYRKWLVDSLSGALLANKTAPRR
ncbi:MAG TPA: TetR/AcrR family transcriptional regulator [Candidatus Methylomirabilis sp.]|nr:TetR/AcrR family transcriptional regulator [Candidatus Methylomirabilis sp.]